MKRTLLTLALVCGAAFAQETVTSPEIVSEGSANDWNLKLGVSYRKFKDPKFTAAKSSADIGYSLDGKDYHWRSKIEKDPEEASWYQENIDDAFVGKNFFLRKLNCNVCHFR